MPASAARILKAWLGRVRTWLAPLAVGMALALLIRPSAGPAWVWGLVALIALLALAARILAPAPSVSPTTGAEPRDPAAALLTPLARRVIEHLPAPVMLLDGGGRVLFVNESMRALLGPDAAGKHVSAVLRNPSVLEAVSQTADDGEASTAQFTLPVPIERHYQAYVARVGAEPPTLAVLLHDLTAIRRSEQMRADFVANASHELRTPLAAVSGFIDTLRGHARNDEAAREKFLEIMSVEAARMRRLIDDLLSLTRIELNEHVPPQGRVRLDAVVREAAAALAPLAEADRIRVEVCGTPDQGLPVVTGERDELVQLFQNLIHNAIKYGRPDGHVWLTLGQAPAGVDGGGQVFAAVRDDGEGIAPSAVPRLTERFYRVDVKRSREKGGTGLGLAIVKHIVSRHQGRLAIESRPGEGSTFTVFLPSAPSEAAGRPPIPAVTEML